MRILYLLSSPSCLTSHVFTLVDYAMEYVYVIVRVKVAPGSRVPAVAVGTRVIRPVVC